MGALLELARRAAAGALPTRSVRYGPWEGSMRSVEADSVPPEYASSGSDFLFQPRDGHFLRRRGQSQKFDTFGASAGLLPAKWGASPGASSGGARARWSEEFVSESIADGVPTLIALHSRETIMSGLDTGRFSQVYVRDQVNGLNYTLGDEFGPSTYPEPGAVQSLRFVPLWYESGEGGMTRGATEFLRRFFVGGSRRFQKVGNWWYFPSRYGTPARWRGRFTPSSLAQVEQAFQGTSDITSPLQCDLLGSGAEATAYQSIDDHNGDVSYIRFNQDSSRIHYMGVSGGVPLAGAGTTFTVSFQARRLSAVVAGKTWLIGVWDSAGKRKTVTLDPAALTLAFADYTASIVFTGAEGTSGTTNRIEIGTEDGTGNVEISYLSIVVEGVTALEANRLIPSGPLPPTHAGSLVRGTAIATGVAVAMIPDADVSDGGWTGQDAGTDLRSYIDEASPGSDADYIQCAAGGTLCEIGFSNPGFTPTASVTLRFRAKRGTVLGAATVTVGIYEGATLRASTAAVLGGGSFAAYSYAMTAAEIAAVGNWNNLTFKLTATGTAPSWVSWLALEIGTATTLAGGWTGSDRFLYSVAYRFEDDSIWAPCTPRLPNDRLANGFNMFTVDADNPTFTYDKVTWQNIPIGPYGTKSRILLRTNKIDSTTQAIDLLSPFGLKPVWEIQDNTTTSYDDYFADDEVLGTLDPDSLFIRYDHSMPPRARHIAAGPMRICHFYGGLNPCALELAPVGVVAAYDRNLGDGEAAAYAVKGTYFRVVIDSAGAGSIQFKAGSNTAISLLFADHPKLQDLVDRINALTTADLGNMWRAQICPGANPDALCLTSLAPHSRALTAVVRDGTDTITRAAGELSKIAVGTQVSGTGYTDDTRVIKIISDTSLQLSTTATAGSGTATFYVNLGDTPDTGFERQGWQRVIANSLPGFAFFASSYLNTTPLEKSATWMTVATPGSVKSAPNCFSLKIANIFRPPLEAGICLGGAGVDNGFVVVYANKLGAIVNTVNTGSGVDEDYRLDIINESRGGCAWNTVVPGNRCAFFLTSQGMAAADLRHDVLLSRLTYSHAPVPIGDFAYEAPVCEAGTAADTDTQYASARVMRGALWVSYRSAVGAVAHPDRQVAYDFSDATTQGLEALLPAAGRRRGWSLPLVRAVTAMVEGRRSDGAHMYGWNDANAGSTGDGRVDEIETGDTDNGVAIAASLGLPWERARDALKLSAQECILEHDAPAGATIFLDVVRSYSESTSTLTPSTTTLVVGRNRKMFPQAARANTDAVRLTYRQTGGGASEVRRLTLRLKDVPALN